MSNLTIRRARPDEAELLSALAYRSKAHWGYSDEFMEACREELRVRPKDCAAGTTWVAELDGVVSGLTQVVFSDDHGEVTDLWVDPAVIGQGIGRALIGHVVQLARQHDVHQIQLDADPHAQGFYERLGFVSIGSVASKTWPDRHLPLMEMAIS